MKNEGALIHRVATKFAAKDQAGLYHDAKKTYQKLTELMSSFDIEELTDTQRDELKLMHRKLNEWAKKF